MNNVNSTTGLLVVIIIVILGLFFTGSMTGSGLCWACDDNHNESGMMSNYDHNEHDDNEHDDDDRHGDAVKSFEIAPGEVVEKIQNNKDVILLDVRTPEEYAEIHLENALLLPVGELSANTLANIGLGEDAKDKEIVIYCRSGARSKQAYDVMRSLGYTNITSVAGGMIHWQEDNYPFTEVGEYDVEKTTNIDANDDGPKISLDRAIHDFGEIQQSQGVVQTTFEVKNTGIEVLEIGELSTSCGCTSAEISNTSINPNDTATLTVYFDPDFHDEPLDKITRTVFIPTNDPDQPEVEAKIKVDILEGE